MVDSDSLKELFGPEVEFGVVSVERIDADSVKMIIEQIAREEAVLGVWGAVFDGEGPAGGAAEGPPGLRVCGGSVVAETSPDLYRGVVPAWVVHSAVSGGAATWSGD